MYKLNKLLNLIVFVKIIVFSNQFQLNSTESQQVLSNSTTQLPTRRLTNEKRLIKDLLDNYQVKWGRPVNNMSEKVVVYFGINLVQLLDLVNFQLANELL